MACANPIPKLPVGHHMGDPATAKVVVEAFVDELCPDCKAAFPTLQALISAYGKSKLDVVLHSFPLPYHSAGFFVSTAAHVVDVLGGDWIQFVGFLFENQDKLENPVIFNKTHEFVYNTLADWASQPPFNIPKADFLNKMADPQMRADVVVNWKWGAARSVSGTPTFFVNGVAVEADPDWTVTQWKQLLDPLFS